ncbi:MAG: 50S ribosomal protein L1 [Puniceicoccales bacterium]|jgi:large subunit ribosomal protein L1|nr:50S ribosomal protein L1 [Puniceicoccales bacterium]
MKKRSKRYAKGLEKFDVSKTYAVDDALRILAEFPPAKFDETVELAMHLGVDPKQGDQMVRGIVRLPHGSGKTVRVLVFTTNQGDALAAGAEYAGLEDLIAKIQDGWCEFDVAIATTAAMREIRPIARILGPRGLMPNPKAGTVSDDVSSAIREVKAGRYEFKMDKTANIALIVGKKSFSAEKLRENVHVAYEEVERACPESVKSRYILSATLSSTMGPGIKLSMKQMQF